MRNRRTYLLRWILIVFFSFALYSTSYSQKSVGVDWDAPEDLRLFITELDYFVEHNISYLVLVHPLSEPEIEELDRSGITYFVELDQEFVTGDEFSANPDQYLDRINEARALYDSSSTFRTIIGFRNSDIDFYDFDFLERKGNQIVTLSPEPIEFLEYFNKNSVSPSSLHEFKDKLEETQSVLLVDSEWLMSSFEEYPEFEKAFLSTKRIRSESIALPDLPSETPIIHWSIIVLVLLWLTIAVNVGMNPTYLETIPRYFTSHRFFVDDIMSYRERSSSSAVFLLFQHAFFGGLVTYILAKVFVSNTGIEALYYHLPYMGILGQNYFSLFVLTAIIVFVVEIIALVWLYVPNKEMTHFNQGLNLFTWIFHLDFLLVTLMVTGYFANWSSTFIAILSLLYLLIWFSSFNITAFDASKRLGMNRNSYLFKTVGLHTFVSVSLLLVLIYFNGWWDILKLALVV